MEMLDNEEKDRVVQLTEGLLELLRAEPESGLEISYHNGPGWLVGGKENQERVKEILEELSDYMS